MKQDRMQFAVRDHLGQPLIRQVAAHDEPSGVSTLFARLIIAFTLALSTSACSKRITFHVDVLMLNDQVVRVEQSVKYRMVSTGELALGLGWVTDTTRVRIPDVGGTVEWESSLLPMILARGGEPARWTMIASPITCEDFYRIGSPSPPYARFDYVDGRWQQRAIDVSWHTRASNLLVSEEVALTSTGAVLTATAVQQANSPVNKVPMRYVAILSNEKSNC